MTEATKTVSIVVAALAVFVAGIVTRPQPPKPPAEDYVGKALFDKLDDPLKIKRIRIVSYDEGAGKTREFEVSQVNGVWSLPSHKGYPADAKDQVSAANTALIDLKVLGVASTDPKDHALYGVVEPDPAKDQFGDGIGKLVVVEGESNTPLARLIIGKEDKAKPGDDFGGSQSKFRYVRIPGKDIVYRASLAADKFSPKFENWIETDLLKLNQYDITQVELRDYSVQEGISADGQIVPTLRQRGDIDLKLKDSKWELAKLVEYNHGKPEEQKLAADQELNTTKLNEMKSALDDLKIVNVERKPARMSANMKAGQEFMKDREALIDLMRRGFTPAQVGEDEFEIKSNDGEAIVDMKDGVEYVLRFGGIAGVDSGSEDKDDSGDDKAGDDKKSDNDKAGKKEENKDDADKKSEKKENDEILKMTEKKGASVNRYVMVMARFNPDLLAKPELEPLPEIKQAPEKADEKKSDEKKSDEKADDKKADEAKADADKSKDENADDDVEAQEARRDKIEKENKRKQTEYDEQVKKAEEKVKELNGRFADWYYVISDATYRKIHLGIDDIIKKKPQENQEGQASPAAPADPFLGKAPEEPAKAAEPAADKTSGKAAGKAATKANTKAPAAAGKK